jgi:hypothetical protein
MSAPDAFALKLLRNDFVPWSDVIWHLQECLIRLTGGDANVSARDLAIFRFGEIAVDEIPALVDAAQAVLASGNRIIVHQTRPAVCRLVDETDLHSVPAEPPPLLRRPFIVEARRPDANERLFGNVASVVGYPDGAAINLFWSTYPEADGYVVRWEPRWAELELGEGPPVRPSPLIGDLQDGSGSLTIAGEAARFLVILGLLLEADNAPLRINDEDRQLATPAHGRGKAKGAGSTKGKWSTRHLFLDDRRPGRNTQTTTQPSRLPTLADRFPKDSAVKAHLKRQPYGAGLSKTRWIWVDRYEARRWVAPGTVRLVVEA